MNERLNKIVEKVAMKGDSSSLVQTLVDMKSNKWGFDLTDIRGSDFASILRAFGMNPDRPMDTNKGWVWKGSGIMVVTANNPITGQPYKVRRTSGGYDTEKDYASYIGIEGDTAKVAKIAELIRGKAISIKGESPGDREFI